MSDVPVQAPGGLTHAYESAQERSSRWASSPDEPPDVLWPVLLVCVSSFVLGGFFGAIGMLDWMDRRERSKRPSPRNEA